MTRILIRAIASAVAVLAVAALAALPAWADPPLRGQGARRAQDSSPGYTLHYTFTSDPTNSDYIASFTPDVQAIYAWATVTADAGAPEEQFTVDIQFIAPDGTPVESEWYKGDDETVITYPEDAATFGDENVARKFIKVAGTSNAQLTGQWTVNYLVDGKLIVAGNFTLADASDLASSDTSEAAENALEASGYTVIEFTELESKEGTLFAFVIMEPVSQDLYSAETTQQIVDGFAALRQSFPHSERLYVFLRYDPRYEVAYFTDAAEVDAYLKSNDFDAFAQSVTVDVYDNVAQKYLGKSSKDFINKNFGGGTYQPPPSPPLAKKGDVGSVRVIISPTTLPADGTSKAIVTVTVYDKRNKPVADAEVHFELSGSGGGTIRPRVTSTDESGQADAVYTAGSKNGTVTITASVGNTSGSGVITVGSGSTDEAQDNVIAYLSAQGFTATEVGYLDDAKKAVGVLIDLGADPNINDVPAPIVYGMTALRLFYPDATTLAVIIPYQNNFLVFPAGVSDYDAFSQQLSAAKSDAEKKAAYDGFLAKVLQQAALVDENGNRVSTFKDFYNKNFGAGG